LPVGFLLRMIKINYPPYHPRIKTENGEELIFDELRKAWIVLTPEEWVRQNFLQYLILVAGYPAELIAVEKEIKLGELKKRFDIVVYDRQWKPWMIVECKEMRVELDQKVLQQLLRYNISLPVPFLVMTNGTYCFAFENKEAKLEPLVQLPSF